MSTTPNLAEVSTILKRHLPAGYEAVLFGSRATGEATPRSDWDIGLIGPERLQAVVMWSIREALEEMPTLHTFDVVDFITVPNSFRKVALRKVIRLV